MVAAYDAPFPEKKYKAGAMISISGTRQQRCGRRKSNEPCCKCFIRMEKTGRYCLFSDKDEILGKMVHFFYKIMPAAHQQQRITIENAGHFLQEDAGEEIAAAILVILFRKN